MLAPLRVLAVGAHPDDIELGALAALLRWKEGGAEVHAVILTRGELAGEDRAHESLAALDDAGATTVLVADIPDGAVQQYLLRGTQIVEEALGQIQPDVVLTQTRWDTHPDHRAVEQACIAACRRRPITLLGYHAISSTPDFPVNMIVDATNHMDEKIRLLRHHRTQLDKDYFHENYLRRWHHEKLATAVGIEYAELFHIYQLFERG